MDLKLALVVLLSVYVCSGQSWRIALKKLYAKQKDKPTTCSLPEISAPALEWRFPANLSCTGDAIIDIHENFAVTEVPVGIQCTFTYMCPFDEPDTQHSSALNCGETGQWSGKMPDCSSAVKTAQELLKRLKKAEGESAIDEEQLPNEEEETVDVSIPPATSQYRASVRKTVKIKDIWDQLNDFCTSRQMCHDLKGGYQCNNIFPSGLGRYRGWFVNFCNYCYNSLCKSSNRLI